MNALAMNSAVAGTRKSFLPPEELALFRGEMDSPLLAEYSQSTNFLILKKFEKLIQSYVLDDDKVLWQQKFREFSREFIRYHYLLDKLSVVENHLQEITLLLVKQKSPELLAEKFSASILAEELRSRQSTVRNRYVVAQVALFNFVDGRMVRLAGQEPINDWFHEGKKYIARLEKAVLGDE